MLEFRVINQTIKRVDRFDPATDSVDYLKATFNFATKDWDGLVKTALFRLGTKLYKATVDSSGICKVPWEVLVASKESTSSLGSKNKVFVSVTGTNGSTVITTNEVRVELATSGKAYGDGENSGTPTPDEFTQFVNTVKDEVATINDTAEAVKQAASDVEKTAEDLAVSIDEVEELAKSNEKTAEIIKNETANAFKGTASGEVVRVDDVSPITHTVDVRAYGKNHLNIPNATNTIENIDGINLIGEIVNGKITLSGTFNGGTPKAKVFRMDLSEPTVNYIGYETIKENLAVKIPKGTYIFSVNQTSNVELNGVSGGYLLIGEIGGTETNGRAKKYIDGSIITVDNDSCYAQFVVYLYADTPIENLIYTAQPQLEKGDTATEYTPYIDPSTVTLTRCGKNLITAPYIHGISRTHNGVTFTVNADGSVKAVGTATADSYFSLCKIHIFDETKIVKTDCSYNRDNDVVSIYLMSGETVNKTFYPQIEVSDTVTNYEQYKGTTYTPSADGTCEIVSVSPTMTLLTDTEGITIECEYNRDTNIVMGDVETALESIIAMQNSLIGGAE